MVLHPSPFLFPGHMCSVINNTGKSVGSALGSAENVTQLWNGFLQNTRQAPVGCAAPPPAFPRALTSVPAMSLETLGKFGISAPFLHPCRDRHMQITCSACISCAAWVVKKFAEVLKGSLTTKADIVQPKKKNIVSVMMWSHTMTADIKSDIDVRF